ncbi:MAG: hypothetical protein ACHP8B_15575 [Terriglobales bacterium]
MPIPGFEPKEVLEFVRHQGINPRNAVLELIAMSAQFGGHPLMLKAACQLISAAPSGAEVTAVAARLPSAASTKSFLEALSNHVFFGLLHTSDQRALLSRLAVLPGLFDMRVALSLARVEPRLAISGADLTLMSSMVLDASAGGRCSFPAALKHVVEENLTSDVQRDELLIAAATTQLTPRRPTDPVDFLDFQAAIFSFILAKEYRAAARYFTLAVPKLYKTVDFDVVRVFFLLLNGDPVHAVLGNDFVRWQLLAAEIIYRAQKAETAREPEVAMLFRRMRSIAGHRTSERWLLRFMLLGLLAGIRFKRVDLNQQPTVRVFARLAAPVLLAIKIAVKNKGAEEVLTFAGFFERSAAWLRISDIDLLKDALLLLQESGGRNLSANALAQLYGHFAVTRSDFAEKLEKLRAQADEFKASGFLPGYVAARYGEALVEHEHYGNYAGARKIVVGLLEAAKQVPQARLLIDRINTLIADTYWAESDYANSATAYAVALKGHHARPIRQHIQERLIDSLISLREVAQAIAQALSILRRRRAALGRL